MARPPCHIATHLDQRRDYHYQAGRHTKHYRYLHLPLIRTHCTTKHLTTTNTLDPEPPTPPHTHTNSHTTRTYFRAFELYNMAVRFSMLCHSHYHRDSTSTASTAGLLDEATAELMADVISRLAR